MKKYFLHDGQNQIGPFDLEELRSLSVKRDTPIWYEGLENWTFVDNVEELKSLFTTTAVPPAFNRQTLPTSVIPINANKMQSTQIDQVRKKRYNAPIIILILSIFAVVGFLIYQNQHKYDANFSSSDRIELEAGGTYIIGPFGMKATINGYLRNTSATKNYRNATIKIRFLNEEQSEIGSDYQTIQDYIPAGTSKNFELKVNNIKGTKTIGVQVSSATPY